MSKSLLADLVDGIFQAAVGLGDRCLGLGPWIARLTLLATASVAVAGASLTVGAKCQGAGPILALLGSLFFTLVAVSAYFYRRCRRTSSGSSR